MAIQFTELCNGTDGVAVTTGNTVFTTVTGTAEFDTAFFVEGGCSILSTGTNSLRAPISGSTHYASVYVRFDTLPGVNQLFGQARQGTTARSGLRINASANLLLLDANTAVDTTTFAINADEWCRIEWRIVAGQHQAVFFRESSPGGVNRTTDPDDTLTGALTSAVCDNIGVCAFQSSTVLWLDRFIVDDATMPAPLATATTVVLDGMLPALTGSFDVEASADVTLAGALPALTGSFDVEASADVTLAGALPALTGSFDVEASADVTLAGALPALTGSFDVEARADVALAGTLPALAGDFTIETNAEIVLTGGLPALTGLFTVESSGAPIVGLIVGDISGPAAGEADIAGPDVRRRTGGPNVRREIIGPVQLGIVIAGPKRAADSDPAGPAVRRDVDGPTVERVLTGAGV